MGYADENAGERPVLWNGGKGGVDRPGVVLFLMLRASELFAGEKGECYTIYCLRRGDVAFFGKNEQLGGGKRHEARMVEVRFRESKADQERKRAVR